MPDTIDNRTMSEKTFWLIVRRALLMVVRAIEARYGKDGDSQ